MDLAAALTLGLLGSMHCIGMCGPLVLAVPSTAQSRIVFLVERIIYNVGRTVTYGVMGAVLGMIGKGIMLNVQQDISIIIGVLILITVGIPLALRSRLEQFSPLKMVYQFVKEKFSMLLLKRGTAALFFLGMVNGLLPCGLVYTALIGATAVADVWKSSLFMIVFGIGTIPALVIISMTGRLLTVKYRSLLTRAIPYVSIMVAVILILRGLNLGIPLLSPKVTHSATQSGSQPEVECCE
jgi:hypothetical protein